MKPLCAVVALALAAPLAAAPRTFVVDPERSRIHVHVGKSGVFGFAGHEHDVVGRPSGGEVVADAGDLSSSSVVVRVPATSFQVDAAKEPSGDAPKVQRTMEDEVLEVSTHPEMSFRSEKIEGRELSPGRYRLDVTGTVTLHGVSRRVEVPVTVAVQGDELTANGELRVRHDAFGLKRVSAGLGTVKVANEIDVRLEIVAVAR